MMRFSFVLLSVLCDYRFDFDFKQTKPSFDSRVMKPTQNPGQAANTATIISYLSNYTCI